MVHPSSYVVFCQAFDAGGSEVPCIDAPKYWGVGQREETKVRDDGFIDVRYWVRIGSGAGLSRSGKRNSAYHSDRGLAARADAARCGGRHHVGECVALVLAYPFEVGEDESLILYNRAPTGCSELVAVEWRQSLVEVVSRV